MPRYSLPRCPRLTPHAPMSLQSYLAEYPRLLADPETPNLITSLKDRIVLARDSKRKLMLAGNGASTCMASHLVTDFSRQGRSVL